MRAISSSSMKLISFCSVMGQMGFVLSVSTEKYDPQRMHTAIVAIATSPKSRLDLGGFFASLDEVSK
jgi:hypothetical protein